MVQATPTNSFSDGDTVLVRAFSSLTRRDAASVRATLRAAGGGYVVEEHDDYDGYLSLVLTPATETRPTFLVSGQIGAVDLATLHGDALVPIGTGYPSIEASMQVLRDLLDADDDAQPD